MRKKFISIVILLLLVLFLFLIFFILFFSSYSNPSTYELLEIDPSLDEDMSSQYECEGQCFCDDTLILVDPEDLHTRRSSTTGLQVLKRGFVVLLSAFSVIMAERMAHETFVEQCTEKYSHICDPKRITVSELCYEDGTHEMKEYQEVHRFLCSGRCMKNEKYLPSEIREEDKKKVEEYWANTNCEDFYLKDRQYRVFNNKWHTKWEMWFREGPPKTREEYFQKLEKATEYMFAATYFDPWCLKQSVVVKKPRWYGCYAGVSHWVSVGVITDATMPENPSIKCELIGSSDYAEYLPDKA